MENYHSDFRTNNNSINNLLHWRTHYNISSCYPQLARCSFDCFRKVNQKIFISLCPSDVLNSWFYFVYKYSLVEPVMTGAMCES